MCTEMHNFHPSALSVNDGITVLASELSSNIKIPNKLQPDVIKQGKENLVTENWPYSEPL